MKLLDILNEKREVPQSEKIGIDILKEYIFKDWQVFNQKVVPSFKLLRNRVMRENYNQRTAKNNIMSIVEFACKKYIAEKTDRRYTWNEMFTKSDRYNLVNNLVEFFEKYNIGENTQLLTEQDGQPIEAKITFSEVEIEVKDNQPKLVLNFNYDEKTTNHITNVLGRNQTLKISEQDFQLIQNMVKIQLADASDSAKMSYLKFFVEGTSISQNDLKRLSGGAFLNRPITLEVSGEVEQEPTEEPEIDQSVEEPPIEQPQQEQPPVERQPVKNRQPVSDRELKEIVSQTIKEFLGE